MNYEKTVKQLKRKDSGNVTSLSVRIKEPLVMNIDELEIQQLNLLVGQNGSGKSFVLVCTWAMTTIAQAIIASNVLNKSMNDKELKEHAQYLFDRSFSEQNIDGVIGVTFESGAQLTLNFDRGKIIAAGVRGFEDLSVFVSTRFLSARMRTFESIQGYLKSRKAMVDQHPQITAEMLIARMCEEYRIYDILYIESLINKMPFTLDAKLKDSFEQFDIHEKPNTMDIDHIKCDFFFETDKGRKYLTTYGAGHQSLINMIIGNT